MIELIVKNHKGDTVKKYVGYYCMTIYYNKHTIMLNNFQQGHILVAYTKIESDIDQGKLVVIGCDEV